MPKRQRDRSQLSQTFLIRSLLSSRCALLRYERKQKPFKVQYSNRTKGFGLFAVRDIAAGETVDAGEEKPAFLVSRSHVEKRWTEQQKRCAHSIN